MVFDILKSLSHIIKKSVKCFEKTGKEELKKHILKIWCNWKWDRQRSWNAWMEGDWLTLLIYMAKWYNFNLSFFIPDSKRKINFRKMKKLMKNLTKYLKNNATCISKKMEAEIENRWKMAFLHFKGKLTLLVKTSK